MTINSISSLSINDLVSLKMEIETRYNEAKQQKEMLEEALEVRYLNKAKSLLADNGQNTGTIHFLEENYTISATVPKKVNWDQGKMECIIRGMTYEQRAQYIDITYKVHEQKFLTHCPPTIRQQLETAREVISGKMKIVFKSVEVCI